MPYILGRNGERYELKSLSRKQRIEFAKLSKDNGKEDFDRIEELFLTLLRFSHPNLTNEQYEDILDYNVDEFGFAETYEMLGYLIEDVFMSEGGKKPNPYLEAKREQHKKQEETRLVGVMEAQ